ncbi:MAG TPA: ABC transporter ATP-binding protein [Terriglobia bacterium]|nr:ABC transporter ATP-binding protein [Terriglobia bacterium]
MKTPENGRSGNRAPDSRLAADLERYLDGEDSDAQSARGGRTARQLFGATLRHPGALAGGFLFVLMATAAALVEPRLLGYAIDEAIIPRNMARLNTLAALFLLLTVIRVVAMIAQTYLFEVLGQAVTQDLRMAVFSHLQRLPLSIHDKNPAGRLLTRVTNDISALAEMFSSGFVTMASNILLVGGIVVWLLALNLRLGLIAIAVLPFMLVATAYFSKQLRVAYREARSRLSMLNAYLAENLMGMKVVNLFNRQQAHLERFGALNQTYTEAQTRSIRAFAYLQPMITMAAGLSTGLLIWFGGNAAAFGAVQLGVLVTSFTYVLALFKPLRDVADKWNVFLAGLAAAEKLFSVLEWPVELPEDAAGEPYALKGHIVFDHVWFAYEGERWVISDMSFEIPAGARVGVVGPTGSGKTTLIALLMRFYEPQRGRILLDGKDLREYERRRLRASFGLIQQDVFLFSGSVRSNLGLFERSANGNKREPGALLKELGLNLDDRTLGERGGNLSAGERQLVAFARAAAADPHIWILDEATANLDSATEDALEKTLERAAESRTLLRIAHRLASTRGCDPIMVLNKGQIAEMGDHAGLMRRNGLYARLFRYQQLTEETGAATEA